MISQRRDQIQQLLQQFNLQTLSIDNTTEIHLFLLTSQQFSYQILKNSTVTQTLRKKKYRLHFNSEFKFFKQQIISFINKFLIKKLRISLDRPDLYRKTQWDPLKQLSFNSIQIYQADVQNFKSFENHSNTLYGPIDMQIFEQILKLDLKTEIFEINIASSIKQVFLLEQILNTIDVQRMKINQLIQKGQNNLISQKYPSNHNNLSKIRYKFCVSLLHLDINQLFQFLTLWCQLRDQFCHLCQQSSSFSDKSFKRQNMFSLKQLEKFEQSSSKIHEQMLRKLRDQTMIIYFRNQQILSLNSSQIHGYSIVMGKSFLDYKIIHQVINLVLRSKYFISLQFQCQLGFVVDALDFIIKKYCDHCNYLIKIGNHIQITSFRLMLNTKNLSPKIVNQIIQLLLLPGHYELIFYGTLDYFEILKKLFLQKLFIKFNYLVPISQLSENAVRIISKMESLADNLRIKVLQFSHLLNAFSYKNFEKIESIFLAMHDTGPTDVQEN